MASLLDIVRRCDNYVRDDETLVPFSITPKGPIIGLLRPVIVKELLSENTKNRSEGIQENWTPCIRLGTDTIKRICFASHLSTKEARSAAIKKLCEGWRDGGVLFQDVMGPRKWRGELYSIYENYLGPHVVKDPKLSHPHSKGLDATTQAAGETNHVFDIERSAAALFGLVTYGVHMTVYEKDDDGTIRLWTPTRSRTKQTWPGYLDNSVAGGIPTGMGLLESLVKESMEEASLPEDLVRKHARAVGVVSYFFRTAAGWLQPEVEYVYDLLLPKGEGGAPFQLRPMDEEVEKFELLPLDEVMRRMKAGLFKANCAVVVIGFMIRHGFITADNEGYFLDIVTRIHRRFDFESYIPC